VLDEGHEYQVVTVGTSITETIKDINRKLTALRMGRAGRDLVLASKIVNDLDGFPNSTRPSNVLPQYLHRDGADYTPPDDPELITNDRGGMRGTFLMLANQKVDGTYYNLNYDSREIRFGTLSGPSIKNKAVVPGVPSNNYLKMTPGADAASVRVMDGYFGAEDGIKAGLTGYNGPFKWAKITYNGALTGGSSDQIAIDVATTLGITVDKILSVTGGLYLASISSFFYLNCNDPSNVIFKDHFLYPDANFVVTLSATYATMYSAASSSNRQFKLFVHYED
jgi:hypothetical protein